MRYDAKKKERRRGSAPVADSRPPSSSSSSSGACDDDEGHSLAKPSSCAYDGDGQAGAAPGARQTTEHDAHCPASRRDARRRRQRRRATAKVSATSAAIRRQRQTVASARGARVARKAKTDARDGPFRLFWYVLGSGVFFEFHTLRTITHTTNTTPHACVCVPVCLLIFCQWGSQT